MNKWGVNPNFALYGVSRKPVGVFVFFFRLCIGTLSLYWMRRMSAGFMFLVQMLFIRKP